MSSNTPNPQRDGQEGKSTRQDVDVDKTMADVSNDQTIDISQLSADASSTDSNSLGTKVSSNPSPGPIGIDATISIDQTVQADSVEPLEQTIDVDSLGQITDTPTVVEQTIQFLENEQTIEIGNSTGSIPDAIGGATVRVGGTLQREDNSGTVMSSRHIDRTISSVEMTGKDASIWGNITKQSLPGSGTAAGSHNLLPKVDVRSIADTRLNLRTRQLLPQDSAPEMTVDADYRLVRLLGKGGMGNVYVARQGSLDRLVALKVIKPLEEEKRQLLSKRGTLDKTERQRRSQFISEAVVTGDLEHPNIVPIHDIAVSEDNTLFYSMKRVTGTPWSKVIDEKSRDENLEILLKVCDAIGFAHTRGIVHRDIKPENIMLGDFGIVMVMDWGLALAKPGFEKIDSIYPATGLGGSPAYMAPEMATGPLDAIEPAADIYLLGATLFQIITGNAPHVAPNITECLRAVASNKIRDVQPHHEGELLDIALKAMATRPNDRYADVVSFQNAIRQYRSHSESIALATKATDSLALAKQTESYSNFARAMFGFEEAIALWDGNLRAKTGLEEARFQYADAAYRNGDFDLALSLLDKADANHQELISKITNAQRERLSRQSRLKTLRIGVAALLAFIIIGGAVSIYTINDRANAAFNARQLAEANAQQAVVNLDLARTNEQRALQNFDLAQKNFQAAERARDQAFAEKTRAEKSEQQAKEQTLIAIDAKSKAEAAQADANTQRLLAEANAIEAKSQEQEAKKQQLEAERQREKSEYESYISRISLVKARIEQNEFDDARRVLDELRSERGDAGLGWEWRWLSHQTKRALAVIDVSAAPVDIAVSQSSGTTIAVLEDGTVRRGMLTKSNTMQWFASPDLSLRGKVTAVAIAPDGSAIALGSAVGEIEVFDGELRKKLKLCSGHEDRVSALCFTKSGLLASASNDRTARLWDLQLGNKNDPIELAACWHLGPVVDLAIASVGDGYRLAAAVAESASGYVGVWNISPSAADPKTKSKVESKVTWNAVSAGDFREHKGPVLSVDISPDGRSVVSGDSTGNALVWDSSLMKPIDYQLAVANAVSQSATTEGLLKSKSSPGRISDRQSIGKSLHPKKMSEYVGLTIESDSRAMATADTAHRGAIRSVSFSTDGKLILTSSDDYTIGVWDAENQDQVDVLRGHGGWVTHASFSGIDSAFVISGSRDRSMKLWDISNVTLTKGPLPSSGKPNESGESIDESVLHSDAVTSVKFDPSGTHIITASRDQTCKLLRFDSQAQSLYPDPITFIDSSKTLEEGSSFAALSLALDPSNQRLFVGSADSSIRVWNWNQTTEIGRIEATGQNQLLALTPNGQYLVTGSSDPDVSCVLWELTSGADFAAKKLREFRGHTQAVTCFAISTSGDKIFTGDRGGLGILWDAKSGKSIGGRIEQLRGYRLNDASFIANDSQLVLSADDFQLTTISIADRRIVSRLSHDGPVLSAKISSNQKFALTVSERPVAKGVSTKATLWDMTTGEKAELLSATSSAEEVKTSSTGPVQEKSLPPGRIVSASFSQQGKTIAIGFIGVNGRSSVTVVHGTSLADRKLVDRFALPAAIGQLSAVTPMPDGQMVTLNGDSAFWWDLAAEQQIRSFRTNGLLSHASFSPDGKHVVTVSQGIKLWDVSTGKSLLKLELPHSGPVFSAQFSPDPSVRVFATGGNDGVVKLWSWSADQVKAEVIKKWELGGAPRAIRSLSFSPDGEKLVAVGDGGLAKMMFMNRPDVIQLGGDESRLLESSSVNLLCAAFSRDGRWLATGGSDAIGQVWSVVDNPTPSTLSSPVKRMIGHADQIEDVHFLEDGTPQVRLLTVSRDKSIRVWDPRFNQPDSSSREVLAFRGHSLGVMSVDVNESGQTVVTSGADGRVLLWPADAVVQEDR